MEKKNKNQEIKMFLKRIAMFLTIALFAWFNLSRADLGTYNIFQDRDQDGLSDKEEISYGTNPDKADTDGDGYSDKVEIESGYDPLKPAPGDKIIAEENIQVLGTENKNVQENNLTEKFFEEIKNHESGEAGVLNKILTEEGIEEQEKEELLSTEGTSLDDVLQKILENDTLSVSEDEDISLSENINILDKPEGTDEEIKQKEKEQIEKYMSSLIYILAVNRPFELDNIEELPEKVLEFVYQVSNEVQIGNLDEVRTYKETIETIFNQIEKLEVPFVMADVHISLLSGYQVLSDEIDDEKLLSDNDPLATLLYLGKIEAAFSNFEVIEQEIEVILEEYEITSFNPSSVFGIEFE